MFFVFNCCLIIFFFSFKVSADFDYKNPDAWTVDTQECGGRMQSPIDIDLNLLQHPWHNNVVTFFNYREMPKSAKIKNTGSSLQIDFEWGQYIPHIHGGPLVNIYELSSIHFHWNTNQQSGSEHKINGESFPLEAHMVHFNKAYNTYGEATKHPDGLAVVGAIFTLSVDDRGLILSQILDDISKVTDADAQTDIKPFAPQMFLHGGMFQNFATYTGSLTTPPCSEGVTWFVPLDPLPVSMAELNMFRSLKLTKDDDHNNRPIQPRNGRSISIVEALL